MSNFNGISKSEIIWVKYLIDDEFKYIITSDKSRNIYYLYKYNTKENKYEKTSHQSNDPTKLEAKYIKFNSNNTIKTITPNTDTASKKRGRPKKDNTTIINQTLETPKLSTTTKTLVNKGNKKGKLF